MQLAVTREFRSASMQDDDEMAGENRCPDREECRNLRLAFGARVSAPQEGFTEAEQKERRAAMPAIFAKTPFLSWLGLVVERYEPDEVATRLPFRLELSNDGSTYHGGVVGAVIDTTGALAAWSNHDFDRARARPPSRWRSTTLPAAPEEISCVRRAPSIGRAS
jgi:hypothetical protein